MTAPPFDRDRARRRARLRHDQERSRASRKLNALLEPKRELHPPSTYGMTADERRAYAAELLASGWQAWEIRERITSPAVTA